MCTYRIALDDGLVMQAENTFQIKEPFQTWLQHITPCENMVLSLTLQSRKTNDTRFNYQHHKKKSHD